MKKIQKRLFLVVYFILAIFFSQHVVAQAPLSKADSAKLREYNLKGLKLMNKYMYQESLDTLNLALKIRENALTYYYICRVHSNQQNWDDVIFYGEKAASMDSNLMETYFHLFLGYISVGRWNDAKLISEKAKKGDTEHVLTGTIDSIDFLVDSGRRSNITVMLLFLVLVGVFGFSFYRSYKKISPGIADNSIKFSEVLMTSGALWGIFYYLFYLCSHWIWSQNQKVALSDFSYLVRMAAMEHDGVESYVMYVMVSAVTIIALGAAMLVLKLRKYKAIYLFVSVVTVFLSGYYFFNIGFYPPEPSIDSQYIFVPVFLAAVSIGLFFLYRYNSLWVKIIVVVIAAFAGLIPLAPPSLLDFNFILSPALRLYHGFKIQDIYFQYDYFLSFIAYAWMKFNINLEWYPYVFTFSFFLFFITAFFFTDRFFKTRGLSVIFIMAMIVARVYLISHDSQLIPQVTPLRLDLWIILLIVAYFKGIHHWLLGVCIGLLVLFHRNLGLIYLSAYLELLLVLFIVDVIDLAAEKNLSMNTVSELVVRHLRLNAKNLIIVISSIALCFVLFKEMFSASAVAYRKLGINFLPVHRHSFYWYFLPVLGCLLVFIFYCRKKLGERYTTTALFVVVLAIANSMYFYGRSHENNVLNLTGILVFTLFVLFDLLIFQAPQEVVAVIRTNKHEPNTSNKNASQKSAINKNTSTKVPATRKSYFTMHNAYLFLPVLFIFFMGYYYSERIYHKAQTQYSNLIESNFPFPFALSFMDTSAVKQLTHNSPNVYFMDQQYDLYYYYYGNYIPQGYYTPFCAFIYKKDIVDFVQSLLDKHYYVIYSNKDMKNYSEYLPSLRYNRVSQKNDIIAISKEDVPLLLPRDDKSIMHVGIADTLGAPGMDYDGFVANGAFTVEVLVKPRGVQMSNAGILNNLAQFVKDELRGFVIQKSGPVPGQYVFAVSNGTPDVPNAAFNLEDNKWHYLVATVNKDIFRIYDNGRLVANANVGGIMYPNSELPLSIGNRASRDAHFSGYIREVKISNGNLDPNEIMSRGQRLDAALNNPILTSTTK